MTTRAGVRNYLEITDSTISLYLKNGTFREGYHFFKGTKGSQSKITFVSGAIEEFKKSKERWFMRLYNRNGILYIDINGKRTSSKLQDTPTNRKLLENQYKNTEFYKKI